MPLPQPGPGYQAPSYEVVPISIHSQEPLKLTGVEQLECCCDLIRIVNALRCLHWQQLTDNCLLKMTRVMMMNQSNQTSATP